MCLPVGVNLWNSPEDRLPSFNASCHASSNVGALSDNNIANGRVSSMFSSTILTVTNKGTARTIPTIPHSQNENAVINNSTTGDRSRALPAHFVRYNYPKPVG